MASMRSITLTLFAALTVAVIAPANAQTPAKPAKQTKPAKTMQPKPTRTTPSRMTGSGMMAPLPGNNTAVVQGNINKATNTLGQMTALLNEIDARKKK